MMIIAMLLPLAAIRYGIVTAIAATDNENRTSSWDLTWPVVSALPIRQKVTRHPSAEDMTDTVYKLQKRVENLQYRGRGLPGR